MDIQSFKHCKTAIENQYARINGLVNKDESQKLYHELRNIYYSEKSKQVGKGKAIRYYFENVRLFINPHDIFADMADVSNTPVRLREEEYQKYKNYDDKATAIQKEAAFCADCDFGHTMPDWNVVFNLGITGIIKRAEQYLQKNELTESQMEFYLSVKYAYEGILIFIKRLQKEALAVKSENAEFAAKNLEALSKGTPKTLAEAMQLFFIYYTAQSFVEGCNLRSLGALDDILYPYYKHDIDNGICDKDDVRELIKYFLFKWNSMNILANIPFNLCTNTNELTYLILEEYVNLNVPDPKIHVKCSAQTPDSVYKIIMDSIRHGNNSFVFMNDEVVKKGLTHIGIEPEDAKDYTIIGCYEPCAAGNEIPCTLNGRINMPMAVEVVLNCKHKYGIGDKMSDYYANTIHQLYSAQFSGLANCHGGNFEYELHSARAFLEQGLGTEATPDGRTDGDETSKNASPTPGMDKNGITALINSATTMDLSLADSGACLDAMIHPSSVQGDKGLEILYAVLNTYMAKGGASIHFNIFNEEMLRDAQKNPEKYKNLQVRVCGWNVLWNNMSKNEQEAYILRAKNIN